MIPLSTTFDLGLDRTRIKDPRDAERQTKTTAELLRRLYAGKPAARWELQLLADEVGMGKTFVALAVAFSVLEAMSSGRPPPELSGCYRKVLIVTPQNHALFRKWTTEVQEFIRRCVPEAGRVEAHRLFRSVAVDRLDDLVLSLRGKSADVIVTKSSVFGEQRLEQLALKRQFTLAALFRYWGSAFPAHWRKSLLRGAPSDWPKNPDRLAEFSDAELEALPVTVSEATQLLARMDRPSRLGEDLEKTRQVLREAAEPYVRNRDELFGGKIEKLLSSMYRALCTEMIGSDLPLVIVDEAHNWKNGPKAGTNGYRHFANVIAPHTRRLLLLTATPFQLRPEEMLELLRIGQAIRPAATDAESEERRSRLNQHAEKVIGPALEHASAASRRFSKAWSRLPRTVTTGAILDAWQLETLQVARKDLVELAMEEGAAMASDVEARAASAVENLDPDIRQLVREALTLFAWNAELSVELGKQVVRHRRQTEHRLVRVGEEFRAEEGVVAKRQDRHVLHAAAGLDVKGAAELPHFILMRCVTEMHRLAQRNGRSSLGTSLTGCWSTLLESAEGKALARSMGKSEVLNTYIDLLKGMVSADEDPRHPKVAAAVERVLELWERGEKALLFCFRSNTAHRLRDILSERIGKALEVRRNRTLGGEKAMRALLGRMQRRSGDLVVLGLDRVLWSWAIAHDEPLDLTFTDEDVDALAKLSVKYKVPVTGERVDRVFLHRATEHIIAQRLLEKATPPLRPLLKLVSSPEWVEQPYGLTHQHREEETEEAGAFDERGVHQVYEVRDPVPWTEHAAPIASAVREARERTRKTRAQSIYDSYQAAPGFWVGSDPRDVWHSKDLLLLRSMHRHLWSLTRNADGLHFHSRLLVFQALRRAVSRESVLVRLLPEKAEREEAEWGELLAKAFFEPLPGQGESMAARIETFLEDLEGTSGDATDPDSPRGGKLEATRTRENKFVSLVAGDTRADVRERAFNGFNSPLLPEVLVCTAVGAEGIDLHRYCRHVIHYDLAWNPAVVEQRTGRVDRIGSKAFREREQAGGEHSFLDVSLPFLAGTYDERMFEELRIRAQMFEVLTGGDVTVDAEGLEDNVEYDEAQLDDRFVTLPAEMIEDLRVQLHVWSARRDLQGGREVGFETQLDFDRRRS